MSDMSTDVRAADAADAATSAQVTHVRRNLWGRLYHGETTINSTVGASGVSRSLGVLIVITLVSLFSRGLNLGIDFEGGVAWEVPSAQITDDQVRTVLDDSGVSRPVRRSRLHLRQRFALAGAGGRPVARDRPGGPGGARLGREGRRLRGLVHLGQLVVGSQHHREGGPRS